MSEARLSLGGSAAALVEVVRAMRAMSDADAVNTLLEAVRAALAQYEEAQMEGLTVGRMVHYVLTEDDATQINRRRTDGGSVQSRLEAGTWPAGAQAHIGNTAEAGQHVAAVVVRVWSDSGMVNLKCLLDGNDDFWASSIPFQAQSPQAPVSQRTWHWIEPA